MDNIEKVIKIGQILDEEDHIHRCNKIILLLRKNNMPKEAEELKKNFTKVIENTFEKIKEIVNKDN